MLKARTAFQNCWRNPRRAALVILTISLGALGLFLYHGLNNGLLAQYRINTIHAKYGHGQIFRKGFYGKVHEEPWKLWINNYQDIQKKLLNLPEVSQVFPRLSFSGILTHGHLSINGQGTGTDGNKEKAFFDRLNIVQGQTTDGNPQKIILGIGLAHALKVQPGDHVTLLANTLVGTMNALDLEVSGIFQMGARDIDDRFFQIEFYTAQQILNTESAESIAVALKHDDKWDEIEAFSANEKLNIEAISFEILDKIYYGNSVSWLDKQFGIFEIIIVFIVLLGVFSTVSVSILERKEEFGFLRSNGESRNNIAQVLVLEALFLSGIGSVFGLALAYGINFTFFRKGLSMPPAPGFTLPFDFKIILNLQQGLKVIGLCLFTTFGATALATLRSLSGSISENLRAGFKS